MVSRRRLIKVADKNLIEIANPAENSPFFHADTLSASQKILLITLHGIWLFLNLLHPP
jgi:hypothetical protein